MTKNPIHPLCQACLKEHSSTWNLRGGKVYLNEKDGSQGLQICSLIHTEIEASIEAKKTMSQEDLEFANFLFNPSLWTKTELAWNARWYQDYMLQCSAFRKVSRIGRRAGKTETICIRMLHYAYTNETVTVLVIAPYKNQVGLIFDKLDQFLGKSDSLKASIKRNTKNPYRVERVVSLQVFVVKMLI